MINHVDPSTSLEREILKLVARRLEAVALVRLNRGDVNREVAAELFSLASELEAESNASHGLQAIRGL